MTMASGLAMVLPGEAYALGRTAVWAALALAAGWYLRKEVRALVREAAGLVRRIKTLKAAGVEIEATPAEQVKPFDDPV